MKNTAIGDHDFGKRFARSEHSSILSFKKLNASKYITVTQSKRSSYFKIKNSLQYPDLCQAADYIDKNVQEQYKALLFGNPLPKNYEELGVCPFPTTAIHFINEINWTLLSIRKYSHAINLFLVYKEDFEKYLITGDYQKAQRLLEKIESEVCFSLWTLENRFLLNELANKNSENKKFLSTFFEINRSEGYTKSLANYLSNRVEKNLSVNRFNKELQAALNNLDSTKKEEHTDFYLFKLSFLNHINFEHFSEIISYDFQHSIIDRYLTLRKVLAVFLTTANNKVEDAEDGKRIREYILNRINYLLRKISDPILIKLKLFSSNKLFPAFDEIKSQTEIDIIDKYTIGQYQEVEYELKKYLLIQSNQFDLYVLYVKSLIYQKKQYQYIGNTESLQNQILYDLYKMISATGNPDEAALNLLRIANNIASTVLSYGISDFVIHRTKGKNERNLFAKLSYNFANPIIHEVLPDEEIKINYLSFLQTKFPKSITIDFLLTKLKDINSISRFEKLIPEATYKIEVAKGLQSSEKFLEASKLWEYIESSYKETFPLHETAVKNLFICYEELKQFDNCINLYVDNFFINRFLVSKIEVDSLIAKIKDNRFRVVSPNIELPIFYTICETDQNELHTTFEKFNLGNKVCRPSELIPLFENHNFSRIIFYLRYTCTLDVLRHSTNINGSKERLEERLSITQFLKEKDSANKEIYNDEIKYISNILIIQKGLIDLDDGKIYVNEKSILANELKDYEAIYDRFKVIASITEKNSMLFLKTRKLTTVKYSEENIQVDKIEYSKEPVFDVYIEMFDAIKKKFLFSKDGIVAYLSTRIRHGVLLGEIRPVFEKFKLITKKEGNSSEYRRNYYWDNVFCMETEYILAVIQNLLKEFSYSVDGLIFDLIQKYLQVFDVEKNKDGWFNYDFDETVLFWLSIHSINSRDYTHFVQQIFDVLWDRTDENLTRIRNNIQSTVLLQFNELFDKLERDLINQIGEHKCQTIVTSIKACSTEMQTVITRISSWFKRSGTSASDFYLENVIDIVVGYADKNKRIELQRNVESNCKIKGLYLKNFADLLWIFVDNILKHSDEKIEKIKAEIATKINENILEISIRNEITKKESLSALKNVSTNSKFNIDKLLNEGKSGYHKAYKILQDDLLNRTNTFSTGVSVNEEFFEVNILINLNELLS